MTADQARAWFLKHLRLEGCMCNFGYMPIPGRMFIPFDVKEAIH